MKVLSLTQPWAALVALGEKRIETRSWPTRYRGPIAIHASKGFPRWCKDVFFEEPFYEVLSKHGFLSPGELPLGVVLCETSIVDCVRTEDVDFCPETVFGNYEPGRYAFVLGPIRLLNKPIAARGALGLWNWESPEDKQRRTK